MEKAHGKITVTGEPATVFFYLKRKGEGGVMQDALAVILIIICTVIFLLSAFIFFLFIGFTSFMKDIGAGWW